MPLDDTPGPDIEEAEYETVSGGGGRRKQPNQCNRLLSLLDDVELWRSPEWKAFASVTVNGHREHHWIRDRYFRHILTALYLHETGGAPSGQAVSDALGALEARAVTGRVCWRECRRVGRSADKIYLDLCDDDWRAIEISASGWKVVSSDECEVRFIRSTTMLPLPEPKAGDEFGAERLRAFVNVESDDDFRLVIGFLLQALNPSGPYPILILNGEQGSAKSTAARLLCALVDPKKAAIRSAPRDERDLFIAASNAHMLAFDNLSYVPDWLSDALCRVSSGGGFGTRELHTDRGETIIEVALPIILNGIPDLASRPDLGERALAVTLPRIAPANRQTERELMDNFNACRPEILGGLLDAVSCALRLERDTHLAELPRMADFVRFVTAAEPALGWPDGTFMEACANNQEDLDAVLLDADPLIAPLRAVAERHWEDGWSGSPTSLLELLGREVSEETRKGKAWPKAASVLGRSLRRIAPPLLGVGIDIQIGRHPSRRRDRLVTIRRLDGAVAPAET